LRDGLPILLADENTQFLIAGESEERCLGYLQQRYRYSIWTQALHADIEDLFVMTDARRRGVGTALINCAMDQAKLRGCRQISVDTNERNFAAMELYRKLGFSAESARWEGGRRVLLRKRF
jgi:ribosomal protein S18 acetylase RimI-like enzyme